MKGNFRILIGTFGHLNMIISISVFFTIVLHVGMCLHLIDFCRAKE